ncbi:MAG: YlmH/Sll1252 family protein, partial [Oscillospiraceae bacterium]|nr:YlmH/Sll1252 family protein [Oscillospiraceae bacterium]
MPRGYQPPVNDEERLLCKKIGELVKVCEARGITKFSNFLDERGQALAQAEMARLKWTNYTFFGGYSGAQRQMLCVYEGETDTEEWPIEAVSISCFAAKNLTHRDFLGALMALNIKREYVGDIIVNGQETTVFLQKNMAQVVNSELTSVGRYNASCKIISAQDFSCQGEASTVENTIPVASMRLDAVL